jgi:hypothetical protein
MLYTFSYGQTLVFYTIDVIYAFILNQGKWFLYGSNCILILSSVLHPFLGHIMCFYCSQGSCLILRSMLHAFIMRQAICSYYEPCFVLGSTGLQSFFVL